jgi:hypothetical protein
VLYEVKENNVLKHYEVKEIKEEEVAWKKKLKI